MKKLKKKLKIIKARIVLVRFARGPVLEMVLDTPKGYIVQRMRMR